MAIAFGDVSSGTDGSGTSSRSVTLSSSGTDVVGLVGVYTEKTGSPATETITGVTWGGVAMTQINKQLRSNGSGWQYTYALANPASGSQTITATCDANSYIALMAIYYTGAKQTGIPDGTGTSTAAGNDESVTFTTTATGAWTIAFGMSDNSGVGAGTNMTSRGTYAAVWIWGDSNGSVTPGSNTIGIVGTGSGNQIVNALSLAPASSPVSTSPAFFLNFV